MASLRQIRRRVRTVEQTQKTTRAMEMVAASKLKRLERRLADRRPYARGVEEILWRHLSEMRDEGRETKDEGRKGIPSPRPSPQRGEGMLDSSPRPEGGAQNDRGKSALYAHPYLTERAVKRIGLVVVTSDRGLCGAYNVNLFRRAEAFLREWSPERVGVIPIGKRGLAYFRHRPYEIIERFTDVSDALPFDAVRAMTERIVFLFESGAVDEVHFLHTHFLKMLSYRITVERFLPMERDSSPAKERWRAQNDKGKGGRAELDAIYEPDSKTILDALVPHYLRTRVGLTLLSGFASEQSHRMFAMRQATENADELIDHLTLLRNKIRQATITKEIAEIVGGAEALK